MFIIPKYTKIKWARIQKKIRADIEAKYNLFLDKKIIKQPTLIVISELITWIQMVCKYDMKRGKNRLSNGILKDLNGSITKIL